MPEKVPRLRAGSVVLKRSIMISGHKTSVTLEDAFWQSFKAIALSRRMTVNDLIQVIDSQRLQSNLSSAVRLFVLDYYQALSKQTNRSGFKEAMIVRENLPTTENPSAERGT